VPNFTVIDFPYLREVSTEGAQDFQMNRYYRACKKRQINVSRDVFSECLFAVTPQPPFWCVVSKRPHANEPVKFPATVAI
jgi:hypothetical protein